MTLLELKTLHPRSAYCCGDILSEDGEKVLATKVDKELEELSGFMQVDLSKPYCAPWDEEDEEAPVFDILGYELAYALLGAKVEIGYIHARNLDRYIQDLWKEIRKEELCHQ